MVRKSPKAQEIPVSIGNQFGGNVLIQSLGRTKFLAPGIEAAESHALPLNIGVVIDNDPMFRGSPVGFGPGDVVATNINLENYGQMANDEDLFDIYRLMEDPDGDVFAMPSIRVLGKFKDKEQAMQQVKDNLETGKNMRIQWSKLEPIGTRIFVEVLGVDGRIMDKDGRMTTQSGIITGMERRYTNHMLARVLGIGPGVAGMFIRGANEIKVGDEIVLGSRPAGAPLDYIEYDNGHTAPVFTVNGADAMMLMYRPGTNIKPRPIGDWATLLHVRETHVYRDKRVHAAYGDGFWVDRSKLNDADPLSSGNALWIPHISIEKHWRSFMQIGLVTGVGEGITKNHPRGNSTAVTHTGALGILPGDAIFHGPVFTHEGKYTNGQPAPEWIDSPNMYLVNSQLIHCVFRYKLPEHRKFFGFCRGDYAPFGFDWK